MEAIVAKIPPIDASRERRHPLPWLRARPRETAGHAGVRRPIIAPMFGRIALGGLRRSWAEPDANDRQRDGASYRPTQHPHSTNVRACCLRKRIILYKKIT